MASSVAAFNANPNLRAEFGTVEVFAAFKKAEAAGGARTFGGARVVVGNPKAGRG